MTWVHSCTICFHWGRWLEIALRLWFHGSSREPEIELAAVKLVTNLRQGSKRVGICSTDTRSGEYWRLGLLHPSLSRALLIVTTAYARTCTWELQPSTEPLQSSRAARKALLPCHSCRIRNQLQLHEAPSPLQSTALVVPNVPSASFLVPYSDSIDVARR